jgi:uncharacterized protein (DUF2141 family)
MRNTGKNRIKGLLFCLISGTGIGLVHAKPVDESTALTVARTFLESTGPASTLKKGSDAAGGSKMALLYTARLAKPRHVGGVPASTPLFYAYGTAGKSFVLVSADDALKPILAYSDQAGFDTSNLSPATAYWLKGYEKEIEAFLENPKPVAPGIAGSWGALAQGRSGQSTAAATKVAALVTTQWSQSPYVNERVPNQVYTGCVATAMAQIMKFWNYPARGEGSHSYVHPLYGPLSADFGATTYNWQDMPNTVTGSNWSVATLMLHAGISVDMAYGANASSAWVNSDRSHDRSSEDAFKTNFGYKGSLKTKFRRDFDLTAWQTLLTTELNAGRPVLYAGEGTNVNHAFICDGYDANGLFHINWGWGGLYNGYFAISALNPGTTPGSDAGYNRDQYALINIEPRTVHPEPEITDMDSLKVSAATMTSDQSVTVTAKLANRGLMPFTGKLCAAVYDSLNLFKAYVETKSNVTLPANMDTGMTFTFTKDGLRELPPGRYYFNVYSSVPGGEWTSVLERIKLYNYVPIKVTLPKFEIALADSLLLSSGTLALGQPFHVSAKLTNRGLSAFQGELCAGLYDSAAAFMAYVENKASAALPADKTGKKTFTFATDGLVGLQPGLYSVQLFYRGPSGSWTTVLANQGFKNFAAVKLTAPMVSLSGRLASGLSVQWNNSSAFITLTTRGSDILRVRMLDASGRSLSSQIPAQGTRTLRIPKPESGGGPYYLRAQTSDGASITALAPR